MPRGRGRCTHHKAVGVNFTDKLLPVSFLADVTDAGGPTSAVTFNLISQTTSQSSANSSSTRQVTTSFPSTRSLIEFIHGRNWRLNRTGWVSARVDTGLPGGKDRIPLFPRFDTIPECDKQTDGRTNLP